MAVPEAGTVQQHQRALLIHEAGTLVQDIRAIPEVEFDRRAAVVLAWWDATQARESMVTKVYTPEQVAEHLSVTVGKVREWLRMGYIKGFKLGPREWRVAEDDLEAFIQRLRDEPLQPDSDVE